jgi:hypothetical protein
MRSLAFGIGMYQRMEFATLAMGAFEDKKKKKKKKNNGSAWCREIVSKNV